MVESEAGELFDEWARVGRAEAMAEGHAPAVTYMLERVHKILTEERRSYRSIDLGCGTGWAVRWLASKHECEDAIGIDVSPTMIQQARKQDEGRHEAYVCDNIMTWTPDKPVHLVSSMEVLYYLEEIPSFLNRVFDSWLLPGGVFIAGLDHHPDNMRSESWSGDLNLRMDRSDNSVWHTRLVNAGFTEVETWLKKLDGRKDVTLFIQGRK